jgi:hypothetical protein
MLSALIRPLLCLSLLLGACSNSVVVTIPPRVDLQAFRTVGLIDLEVEPSLPLRSEVTHRFLVTTQAAQPGVRLLELGPMGKVLNSVGYSQLDFEAVRAIGQKYAVDALLTGQMTVSQLQPNIAFDRASLTTLNAKAQVDGALRAKLQDTASGATLWTNGAHGKWTIAGLHIGSQGAGSYGITEPGKQYEAMLTDLVKVATQDFRPTYQRRRVD